MAEAMICGIPVITTNWGGQLDFCNRENSWLVDYEFEYAKTHFNIFNSVWARAIESDLVFTLRQAFASQKSERTKMAECGRRMLLEKFRWDDVAIRFTEQIDAINIRHKEVLDLKMGVITSWNTKCGIASYSDSLVSNMSKPEDITIFAPYNQEVISEDGPNVKRLWKLGSIFSDLMGILDFIIDNDLKLIIIQFHFTFFDLIELSEFILRCKYRGITVVIIMHSTINSIYKFEYIKNALSVCDRILVHSTNDLNNLKKVGIVNNAAIFPHGIKLQENAENPYMIKGVPVIGTFGFCFPHKGILELIDAVQILSLRGVKVKLMILTSEFPSDSSHRYVKDVRKKIKDCGLNECVYFNSEFLEEEELSRLLRLTNLMVFCYQRTDESASGAIRYGISMGVPVIATPAKIFDELKDCIFRFEGFRVEDIANGIEEVINHIKNGSDELENVLNAARNWTDQNDFKKISIRLENICKSLYINKNSEIPDSIVEVPDQQGSISAVIRLKNNIIEL
jgi:glycosyltransferase involved in cell wall biosynthesis